MSSKIPAMREHARLIFEAGIAAVDPVHAVQDKLKLDADILYIDKQAYNLRSYTHVYVVGVGKAAASMAAAVEACLEERITAGLIVTKYAHALALKKIIVREAGHPIPDEAGLHAARELVSLLEGCGENDLVISLISGGGSALLPFPAGEITLAQKQALTAGLLKSGASIHEMNTVRKHISRTKGGGLARAAYPATVINLMLSDVMGDDMDVIAAGPFVPDRSSFQDAAAILKRYGLLETAAATIREYINNGIRLEKQTPISTDAFQKVHNLIIADNRLACMAALDKAGELGYAPLLLSSMMGANVTDSALLHCAMLKELIISGHPIRPPACIISGGECTVKVTGRGLGGRNQEFALVCGREIAGLTADIVILSAGTDGTDGPTDAAGGLADPLTVNRGAAKALDISAFLANNDAYHYLQATGDLLITGPTRTNVMDMRILLAG